VYSKYEMKPSTGGHRYHKFIVFKFAIYSDVQICYSKVVWIS
jgi:hypothetical protein